MFLFVEVKNAIGVPFRAHPLIQPSHALDLGRFWRGRQISGILVAVAGKPHCDGGALVVDMSATGASQITCKCEFQLTQHKAHATAEWSELTGVGGPESVWVGARSTRPRPSKEWAVAAGCSPAHTHAPPNNSKAINSHY